MPEKSEKKISVGGQAIIEGVMMRAGQSLALAARRPDGTIAVEEQEIRSLSQRWRPLRWPVLRGALMFFESLYLGLKALEWSSRQALTPDTPAPETQTPKPVDRKAENRDKLIVAATLALGAVLGVLLFVVAPYYAALATSGSWASGRFLFNLLNGAYKLGIFLLYLWLMSWIPDLQRVFMYHGAEHKSIGAWEAGTGLTVESALGQSRFHPRCSTAFLLLVMMVAILTFALCLPRSLPLATRLAGEMLLLLPIAGATYELQRLAARHQKVFWVRWLSRPGLALQGLTTREPDALQLEVALTALRAALEMEKGRTGENLPAAKNNE